eukprot:jgi/Mesen1/6818/ME000035S06195
MMGSEDDPQEARLFPSSDAMDSLFFDPSSRGPAGSEYRSNMAGNSEFYDSDPLSHSNMPSSSIGFSIDDHGDLGDPPSYQEAMFAPYPNDGSESTAGRRGEHSSGGTPSSPSRRDFTLKIVVTDPQKVQDANGSLLRGDTHMTYLVATETNIPEFSARTFATRRRFKDFLTLADRLAETHRGYFIPPRPDKNVVESQVMHGKEFIEMRRVALEKYLQRLAVHPILSRSRELRLFLETEGKLPLMPTQDVTSRVLGGAAKLPRQLFGADGPVAAPSEAAQPAKGGRDLMRMFKELRQSVANDWTGGGAKAGPAGEDDKEFNARKEKLEMHAEQLVKAQHDAGEAMGGVGLAFKGIARFEQKPAHARAQHTHAADAAKKQLHEYLAFMQALHTAFADRAQAVLTVQTLATDLEQKRAKVDQLQIASSKILGGDKNRTRQRIELEHNIGLAEEARKERNQYELDRLESERHRDFYSMLEGFVRTQV